LSTSIRGASIDAAFAQASQRRTVTVNNIQISKPFHSPDDWRDQWIYFLMIDRFNKPSGPPTHLPFDDAYGGFQGETLQDRGPPETGVYRSWEWDGALRRPGWEPLILRRPNGPGAGPVTVSSSRGGAVFHPARPFGQAVGVCSQ
jgi:hypothetical protein